MTNSEAVSLLMNSEYYNKGYKQGVSDVLDKIKAEIKTLLKKYWYCEHAADLNEVLEIIDKYKESENVE